MNIMAEGERKGRPTKAELAFARGEGIPPVFVDPPCAGMIDVFFPARTRSGWEDTVAYALRVCSGCRYQEPCFRAATERGEIDGVWGGHDFWATGLGKNFAKYRASAASRRAAISAVPAT